MKDVIFMWGVESKFYGIKDFCVDYMIMDCYVCFVFYWGIGVVYIVFVVEVFMDELVEVVNWDLLDFWLDLVDDNFWGCYFLEKVVEMFGWRNCGDRVFGLFFVGYSFLMVVGVVEVDVDVNSGEIWFKKFWVVVDVGLIVILDNVYN